MKRLLIKDLFENFDKFKNFLINNDIKEEDIFEDWYDYIFIMYGDIRTRFMFYKEVFINIVFQYKKLLSKWKIIEEINKKYTIDNVIKGNIKNTTKRFSTNEIGEDVVDYQIIGKQTNENEITGTLQNIKQIYDGIDLLSDKTINLLNNFISNIQAPRQD